MNHKVSVATISLAVVSMALALPSLINQPVEASNHWCEHRGHSNNNWITGCKNGWYDCDNGHKYNDKRDGSQYRHGYATGWNHAPHC